MSASVDDLLTAALERGSHGLETGRHIVTFRESATDEGVRLLSARGVRVAHARDFRQQAVTFDGIGDADAVVFPEIGAAVIGGGAKEQRGLRALFDGSATSVIETIEPEHFVFTLADPTDPAGYLRGFTRAAEAIAQDLQTHQQTGIHAEDEVLVVGATWGLIACHVPPSVRSGAGIKVAVVDGGMDLAHPDFVGRTFVTQTFVGQPVQDPLGHATHVIGTACGPKAPAGAIPRYGIGFRTSIHVGKVINNSGAGTTATVLAGLNWAIGHRCSIILTSVGSQTPPQTVYTAAGAAALNKGCVIIAAAGHSGGLPTGAPANSPTILAVASLDQNLTPSAFNSVGKIEMAAPGRDVFSSLPGPLLHGLRSGTSSAAAHVAGCGALWAESNPTLRGIALWKKLVATSQRLPFPAARVGAGLVQAAP